MILPVLQSTRKKYWIALGLVALLSLLSFSMLRQVIYTQHGNAAKINLSGRQRMLSQRTALYASLMMAKSTSLEKIKIRDTLKATIDLFEQSHEQLVANEATQKIDRDSRAFVREVRELLGTRPDSLKPELPAYQAILAQAAAPLLAKLDQAVLQYQGESEQQIQLLEHLEAGVLLITLLLLVIEALFIFHPLTESLARSWKEAQDDRKRAEVAGKMAALGQLASSISHEILNPVTNIRLSAEVLNAYLDRVPLDRQKVNEAVSRVTAATSRIERIVLGLRHFSHQAESEALRVLPIGPMIDETLDFATPRFKAGEIELRVKPYRQDLLVRIRPTQISQVLINLLNNAYDAVCEVTQDRWVELEVRESGECVQMVVANGGPLISAEAKAKVGHESFTTKSPDKGTGLGLTISKRILDEHGGTLKVEDNTRYTTFVVSLPKGSNA